MAKMLAVAVASGARAPPLTLVATRHISPFFGCPMTLGSGTGAAGAPLTALLQTELAYIDTLVNLKIRLDDVKKTTQIQNSS